MQWRLLTAAGLTVAALTTGSGLAQPGPVEETSPPCGPAIAELADLRAVATRPQDYLGRCVSVSGIMQGLMLFADIEGIYETGTDMFDPSSNGARVGLANPPQWAWRDGYHAVSITGRVQNCEQIRDIVHAAAAPGEFVWVSGYCHHSNGTHLWVEHLMQEQPQRLERRLEGEARTGFGDLQHAPDSWPHNALMAELAADFLRSLVSGDDRALAAMHFEEPDTNDQDSAREVVSFLLRDEHSPFREIRAALPAPQTAILIDRPAPGEDYEDDINDYSATICFCREQDCTGRWPIASWDADNLATRPYACTNVHPYVVFRRGTRPMLETLMSQSGLIEPMH